MLTTNLKWLRFTFTSWLCSGIFEIKHSNAFTKRRLDCPNYCQVITLGFGIHSVFVCILIYVWNGGFRLSRTRNKRQRNIPYIYIYIRHHSYAAQCFARTHITNTTTCGWGDGHIIGYLNCNLMMGAEDKAVFVMLLFFGTRSASHAFLYLTHWLAAAFLYILSARHHGRSPPPPKCHGR